MPSNDAASRRIRREFTAAGYGGCAHQVDLGEVQELIRVSERLRHRSHAVQLAATRASRVFRNVLRRSDEGSNK